MTGKFAVLRGEETLAEISPSIKELYDRKMSAIVARKEEAETEVEETKEEMDKTILEALISLEERIEKIEEALIQAGLSLPEEEEEEE
ncbi:hypothetical protein ES703_15288 [subsurface metagenome]